MYVFYTFKYFLISFSNWLVVCDINRHLWTDCTGSRYQGLREVRFSHCWTQVGRAFTSSKVFLLKMLCAWNKVRLKWKQDGCVLRYGNVYCEVQNWVVDFPLKPRSDWSRVTFSHVYVFTFIDAISAVFMRTCTGWRESHVTPRAKYFASIFKCILCHLV